MSRFSIDFYCNQPHYVDHAVDLWKALPNKGKFFIPKELHKLVEKHRIKNVYIYNNDIDLMRRLKGNARDNKLVVFAYYYAEKFCNVRDIILMEHGAGLVYKCGDRNWGRHYKDGVLDLFLTTNNFLKDTVQNNNPNIECITVGSPKMDKYFGYKKEEISSRKPVIAVSTHWGGGIPEVQTSFHHFKHNIAELSEHFDVIGHGHPSIINELKPFYDDNNIRIEEDWNKVIEEADVYVCDNSSTIWEFARLDKPIVLLNPPHYRKEYTHDNNPRFWEYADAGVQVSEGEDLVSAVKIALEDREETKSRRGEAVDLIYPYFGSSVDRCVEVLQNIK